MRTCSRHTTPDSTSAGRVRRRWRDYTPAQRAGLVAFGALEVGLAAAAWADLARRDQAEVRGRKWVWALVIAINIVGPLAYFRWGRHATADDSPGGSSDDAPSAQRRVS